MLHRGDIFAGRYRVERCIGSGGMGAVYEAEHLETERRVALKVLHPQALHSESARDRFKQEARVAAKIRHVHVVDVLDAGVDEITDMPYLVMEMLHGEDLATRIGRLGPLAAEEAVMFLQQAAAALDCLHERQIVHRDLKPENLFLTWADDGTPTLKLLDFGVAKVLEDGRTSALTQDAQGTPVYMAPEQFAEQIRISPATDIYALGLLAFTLLTGKQYWGEEIARGMNVFMLARIAEAGPKELATVRAARSGSALPPAFDEWFTTITAIVPGERYPTATVAVETLAEALGVELSDNVGRSAASSSQNVRIQEIGGVGPPSSRAGAAAIATRGATSAPSPPRGAVLAAISARPQVTVIDAPISEPAPSGPLSGGTMTSTPPLVTSNRAPAALDQERALDAAPQSDDAGGTPPIPLSRTLSIWRRPSIATYALLAGGGVLAFIGAVVRPRSVAMNAGPSESSAPPSISVSALFSSAPSAPASSAAPPDPSASAPSTASSTATAVSSATPAASSATPPRGTPRRTDPLPKKPKYTRD
ncbi:MAG: protein kinase [Polyangiaceae bacterium]